MDQCTRFAELHRYRSEIDDLREVNNCSFVTIKRDNEARHEHRPEARAAEADDLGQPSREIESIYDLGRENGWDVQSAVYNDRATAVDADRHEAGVDRHVVGWDHRITDRVGAGWCEQCRSQRRRGREGGMTDAEAWGRR